MKWVRRYFEGIGFKGNMPINDIINIWSMMHTPSDWEYYRVNWLAIFGYRQLANIIRVMSL